MARRLSDHEKKLVGSREKIRNHPQLRDRAVIEPDWLDLLGDERAARDAAAWWAVTVPELDRSGIVAKVDTTLLVECATCVARIAQCERELGSHLMVAGQKGNLVRNPVSMTLTGYRSALAVYIKNLGLSPIARQSLDLKTSKDELSLPDKLDIIVEMKARGYEDFGMASFQTDMWDLALPEDLAAQYGCS